jgi:hypothetical protein
MITMTLRSVRHDRRVLLLHRCTGCGTKLRPKPGDA